MDKNYIRPDWTLFQNMDTLQQKAGVSKNNIGKLVAKELTDNAIDASEKDVQIREKDNYFYVYNDGEGIPEDKIAELFSINRPLITSKLLRMPDNKGALGNGLRVVTGAVIATNGKLFVLTNGHKYEVVPQADGSSIINKVGTYEGTGTVIAINLGDKYIDSRWANDAVKYNLGEKYKGDSSGYWYNSESFYDLVRASNNTVYDLVTKFDGCKSTKASTISKGFGKNKLTRDLTFEESEILLTNIRKNSKPVNPSRLGEIGELPEYSGYNCQTNTFKMDNAKGIHEAIIPIKVEVFIKEANRASCKILINKSPIIKDTHMLLTNKNNNYRLYLGGLNYEIKTKSCEIVININTAYVPITSDGKEPDLEVMRNVIEIAIDKAIGKYKRNTNFIDTNLKEKKLSQKDIILNNLDAAVKKASGDGNYRFSQRQLFYAVRPYIIETLGKEPTYENFTSVLTAYENENGDIKGIYRDARGSLYTPHTGETIPIGTLSVEDYKRPEFTFNKILYIEKEGFFEILKDVQFPEKYDIALLTGKGYASRAIKDLIDLLGESKEELQVFCLHDCDKAGTGIYESLQEATKARPERKIKIINLGLDPQEARDMNLEVESIEKNSKCAAKYISPADAEWLETHRVELNSMTTPQFIQWLDMKMDKQGIGKVIPEVEVLQEELKSKVIYFTKNKVKERILEENNFEKQCKDAVIDLAEIIELKTKSLKDEVESSLISNPVQIWRNPITLIAQEII